MKSDNHHRIEADQYIFFCIPRLLVRDKRFAGLSSNAKLLYGLLVDRMSHSMGKEWIDGDNRRYIYYPMNVAVEDLGCTKSTCVRIMAELDDKKGVGLIERVRQGQGKPDRIYVKNIASLVNGPNDTGENVDEG